MQQLRFLLAFMAAGAMLATAQDQKTDAQKDGLMGPVRTVVIHQKQITHLDPQAAWVIQSALGSGEYDYDRQGDRIQVSNDLGGGKTGGFGVEVIRDGTGLVKEKICRQHPGNRVIRDDVYGPFGVTESRSFSGNRLSGISTIAYDAQGHVTERATFDADGAPLLKTELRLNADGQWIERTMWNKGAMLSHETYDPDIDLQHYTGYDKSGAPVMAFTYQHGKYESFWTAGDGQERTLPMMEILGNGDTKRSTCRTGGVCTSQVRHAVYSGAEKRNPVMTEVRDDSGKLLYRAYYQYTFDDHQNWTTRTVWFQAGEAGSRAMYEADERTISYWPQSEQ